MKNLLKLEEIFISFKAVAGGFVNPVDGNVAIAKSIFDALGDTASIVPIVGTAVDKFLKWTVSKGLAKLDNTRQKNKAINASGLVTLSEVKKYTESIARQLTERYTDQLQQLATSDEEQAVTPKPKQGLAKIEEITLKSSHVPPAKQLAAFGVLWMIDELYDAQNIDGSKELDEALLSVISQKTPPNKTTASWNFVIDQLRISGIRNKSNKPWHPQAVYTLPGLRVGDKYYSAKTLESDTYGFRLGTMQEVQRLGLSQVPAPSTQASVLENQKVVQSISVANNAVKKVEQKTDEHDARIEKIEKTGDIAGGARLRALQQENEELKKRMERLELASFSASPTSKRRPSGIKDFSKRDEKENMLDALKELRKFFLGQRDEGEESANTNSYEKYLTMANKDAELIYKTKDKKHIICINGNELDNAAAAQTIWNMIKALEHQTQATLPPAYEQQNPAMLTQFNQPEPPAQRLPARLAPGFKN